MDVAFVTCDVFTDERFGGNPLAIVLEAQGLNGGQMQQIAAEFNYSETAFVLPARNESHTARLRIFTPRTELQFAGHPNVGTALMLADLGLVSGDDLVFESAAGSVHIRFQHGPSGREGVLTAPARPTVGKEVPVADVVAASGLPEEVIATGRHQPVLVSAGTEFLFVELADLGHLSALAPSESYAGLPGTGVYFYVRSGEGELRGRMFAPRQGVAEDPATGSAAAALAGLLTSLEEAEGDYHWRLEQGLEMDRPSRMTIGATRHGAIVTGATVGGGAVAVARGMMTVE